MFDLTVDVVVVVNATWTKGKNYAVCLTLVLIFAGYLYSTVFRSLVSIIYDQKHKTILNTVMYSVHGQTTSQK